MSEQTRPPAERHWFYAVGPQQHGPITQGEIISAIRAGQLGRGTLVWCEGMTNWMPTAAVPEFSTELANHLSATGAPAPPITPPPFPRQEPNPASWILGIHDKGQTGYHQGRLIGSIDSMIFGILSVVVPLVGLLFAAIAIPVASKAIRKANAEPGLYSGKGMAVAGLALGLASLVLHALIGVLLFVALTD